MDPLLRGRRSYSEQGEAAERVRKLPGAGPVLAPWIYVALARYADQCPDGGSLAAAVGIAPVTDQSGKMKKIYRRFLACCLLYFSLKTLECMPRFLSVVAPFYCTLGEIKARWPSIGDCLFGASAALLALSVVLFANGYWFT